MTDRRKQLEQLNKEQLIESHLLLEGRVRTLEKQMADLREMLSPRKSKSKPRKTAKNSSLPPSQDEKANKKKKSRAKRGPKKAMRV